MSDADRPESCRNAKDNHASGESGSGIAELAMKADIPVSNKKSLNDEENDPGREERSVDMNQYTRKRSEKHSTKEVSPGEASDHGKQHGNGDTHEVRIVGAGADRTGYEGGHRFCRRVKAELFAFQVMVNGKCMGVKE